MRTRREVRGNAHVARTRAAATPFTESFQDLITRVAWGDGWQRPGLTRRRHGGAQADIEAFTETQGVTLRGDLPGYPF